MDTNGSTRIRFKLKTVGAVLLLAALALAIYGPALRGPFVWDDDAYFTYNQVRAPNGLHQIWFTRICADYWPVTSTTLWLEHRLWGESTFGYHVTNLLLHLAEAGLFWAVLRRLNVPGALFAAVLYTIHPVNVESVAWIAERKNLMAMLFFLLTLLFFVQSGVCQGRANKRLWFSLGAFVLAMLSKASVAPEPLVLAGLIAWHRPLTRRDAWLLLPFFVVAAGLVDVNLWFRSHGYSEVVRAAGLPARLAGAGAACWFYISKALVPVRQILIYPAWGSSAAPAAWLPLAAAAGFTWLLWRGRDSGSRPLLAAWAFFLVMLIPVLGLTDVYFMRYSLVADHYQQLALLGPLALAGAAWAAWRKRAANAAIAAAIAVVLVLTARARVQADSFLSEEGQYRSTLALNPDCWLARNNLGMILAPRGQLGEAMALFHRALQLKPDFANAHSNLGTALSQIGRTPEAIAQYREAIRDDPTLPDAYNGLGNSLIDQGRLGEALPDLRKALQLKPDFPEAHNGLGNLLVRAGRLPDAVAQFEEALRLRPDFPEADNNLAVALDRMGRDDEAIVRLEDVLRLHPAYADAHANLAVLLRKVGRTGEAETQDAIAARLKGRSNALPPTR